MEHAFPAARRVLFKEHHRRGDAIETIQSIAADAPALADGALTLVEQWWGDRPARREASRGRRRPASPSCAKVTSPLSSALPAD
jgi:hypothetical protein